jgi:hypothetical protein
MQGVPGLECATLASSRTFVWSNPAYLAAQTQRRVRGLLDIIQLKTSIPAQYFLQKHFLVCQGIARIPGEPYFSTSCTAYFL